MTKDDIKKKVAKLLALALDQAGKPEGELASRKAMDIMEQWGISQGEVDPTKDGCQMHREIVEVGSTGWMYRVTGAVGKLTGLFVACGGGSAWLMGREIDTAVAAYLLQSLMNQCKKDCNVWRKEQKAMGYNPSRVDTNVFKESWAAGLHEKVDKILRAQREASAEADTSEALTTVGRGALARNWAKDQWSFGNRQRRDRSWNADGRAAGRDANVQTGVGGKRTRQLTS